MYDISLIKSRINCIEYAQRLGLPVHKDGDRCCSPLRAGANNKTAFVVHHDYWYDFVAGKGGDVIDLCAITQYNGDKGAAIEELAKLTGVYNEDERPINWKALAKERVEVINAWHKALRQQDVNYLHNRRITEETIKRLRIGYTGSGVDVVLDGVVRRGFAADRIAIPAFKNGYVISWVARATHEGQQPKYLKPPLDDLTDREPWGLHTLDRGTDRLYIAEGAFDYLALEQEGFPVLATMGGYFGKEQLRTVFAIAKHYKRLVLTFDNDPAGRKFARDLGMLLFERRIPFDVLEIPHKYKDVSDYYADGGDLKALELRDGIFYLAGSITDKDEFKKFAYKAARIMDRAELAEMFAFVSKTERFAPIWLKEIQGSCYKAPPEPVIVSEILDKHKLLYVPNVGFYEYVPQGKWTLLNDEIIHGYISDALGVFRSGSKLEPIKKLLRPEVLTTQVFDRAPVVNFINGTLELDTGVFREHREDDYCSIQLPYPYLPEAKAPRWTQFIEEITANDEKRKENLQFIAGYTLFNDCRHEKIFVLTGEGSNGKSIYTKILTQLFGPENVRNITPQGLTEAFEAIHLRNALLNIAGEIRSDLSSAEERLKQIASGESIQACYKGKDHINFIPRAKLIFACNSQLKSSDTSDGLARRLIIINFPCKFVDFPDKDDPLQHEKDIYLYDKLMQELPGIFNWAYQGYKDLLRFGGFTETDEHEQLMRAFRRASNPVEVFVADMLDNPPRSILRTDLYRDYRNWCEDNGHKPLSSTKFYSEFERCTRKVYMPFERSARTSAGPRKERGFELIESTEKRSPKCSQMCF